MSFISCNPEDVEEGAKSAECCGNLGDLPPPPPPTGG